MTVNTYWHDNNLDPSDYLTTVDAGTTYVPYTGATGDVDLGSNSYEGNTVVLNALPENEIYTLGSELLDDTGWTSVGWTGSWSTGWAYYGASTVLSRAVSVTIGNTYIISIIGGGECNVTLGGVLNYFDFEGTVTLKVTATTTDGFSLEQLSWYGYSFFISIKEIVAEKVPSILIKDSNGIGGFSIYSSDSTLKNLFIGKNSGKFSSTAYDCLGLGDSCLSEITSGFKNIAIGNNSLKNFNGNTTLSIGYDAGKSLLSGGTNTIIGYNALKISTLSNSVVAIGGLALENNTGNYNVAIGVSAMRGTAGTSTGGENSAVGHNALSNNTTGGFNCTLGSFSLYNNTTGGFNIAIGYSAGSSYGISTANLNSTYSIFLGPSTKPSAANGVNEIVIGYSAVGNGSNTVTIGHTTITSTYLRGDIYPVDGKNIVLGTTTGMKIGTATTQKIGFFNATPVVQQAAATDLGTTLSNLGLRAAGTAYPITTSGAVSFTGNFTHNTGTATFSNGFTIADARNIVLNTTTGTKIGTATTQKLGFYNATPIVQPTATTDLGTVLSNLGLRAAGTAYPLSTSASVSFTGSLTLGYRAITALRTLDATDYLIDCTANTFTVTLPTAASITGRTYIVKNTGTGIITVATTSSQTIDGELTQLLYQYDTLTVVSNGSNWLII